MGERQVGGDAVCVINLSASAFKLRPSGRMLANGRDAFTQVVGFSERQLTPMQESLRVALINRLPTWVALGSGRPPAPRNCFTRPRPPS